MTGGPRFSPEQQKAFAGLYENMQDCYPKPSRWQRLRNRFRRTPPCSVPPFTDAQPNSGADYIGFDGCTCLHDETPDK